MPPVDEMLARGELMHRLDSWVNAITAMGTGRDRTTFTTWLPPVPLTPQELASMYAADDLVRVIIDTFPEEMMRQSFEIVCDAAWHDKIQRECERLHVSEHLTDANVYGGLFGGCLLWVGTDDGHDPSTPVTYPGPVRFLEVIDRRYANPEFTRVLDPRCYEIYPIAQTEAWEQLGSRGIARLHRSRVLRFGGVRTDVESRLTLNGWDWSVLQAEIETIKAFQEVFAAARYLIGDASQAVLKLKGLLAGLAGGKRDDLITRAQLLDMTRGIARSIILDADSNESFERHTQTFAGVADMLAMFARRLSAATQIPVTVLMGQAPAGLNATGDSDMRIFYDRVASKRRQKLEPHLLSVLRRIAGGLGYRGPLAVKWPSLWQESPAELAARRKTVAETDAIYLTNEVLTPEEVAENRFKESGWSDETRIDLEHRRGNYLPPPGTPTGEPATPGVPPAVE